MALLEVSDLTFGYGAGPVLAGATMSVEQGEHIGLVGANGSGKSTLVQLIAGDDVPQTGTVRLLPGASAVVVPQFFPTDVSGPLWKFVMADLLTMRNDLASLETRMSEVTGGELTTVLHRYGELRERYDNLDGDNAEDRARSLLSEMGLQSVADTDVRSLSGGEQNRAQIVRAFALRPELLILDEPGNHLDLWGLDWLEQTLADYPAAVIAISHNRFLLDRIATRIVELRSGRLTSWSGNFSSYRAARLREAVKAARDSRADAKHLARLEAQVHYLAQLARSVASTSVGKRLRARRTQLEFARQEARERPELTEARAAIRLDAPPVRSDIALHVQEYSLTVGDRTLLRNGSLQIHCGERVALVGPNGCGKTTLLRAIVEHGSWDNGHLRVGPSMVIGYCAQQQELFPGHVTLEEAISRAGGGSRDRVFSLLSRYQFRYEDLDRNTGSLSGGERNRLQLAHAEVTGANFLILDEPTNHLDIPGREAVEEALLSFQGTILVVSHDRYFLDEVATRIVAFERESLVGYDLSFRAYWSLASSKKTVQGNTRVAGRELTIEERLMQLEEEMARCEREVTRLYTQNDLNRAADLSRQLDAMRSRYNRLYSQWE